LVFGRLSYDGLTLPVVWSVCTDVVMGRTYFILKVKQSEKSLFFTILLDRGYCLAIRLDVSQSFQRGWILGLTCVGFKQSNVWTAYKKFSVNRYTALIASVDYQFIQIFRVNATLRIINVHNTRPQGVYTSCFYTLFR
jgi:hypothetical protein